MRYNTSTISLLFMLLLPLSAQSTLTGDSLSITFQGRMLAMDECQVNQNQPIEIPFGNVGINKVSSGQYIKPLDYQLSNCGSGASVILMTFKATSSGFDEAAMSTNVEGLGVKILKDGQPFKLNEAFKIADAQHPPLLQVQLVKDPAVATLQAIPFTAIGTLVVEYV